MQVSRSRLEFDQVEIIISMLDSSFKYNVFLSETVWEQQKTHDSVRALPGDDMLWYCLALVIWAKRTPKKIFVHLDSIYPIRENCTNNKEMKSKQGIWICPVQVSSLLIQPFVKFFIYAEKFRRSMTRWRRRWRVGSTGWEQNTQKRFRHHSQQQEDFVKDHEKQMLVGGGAGNKDICSTLRQDGHGLPGEQIRGNQPDEEQSCCDCEKTIIWHNSLPFQMKEEVEGEYAERMEGLREIYRWVKWWNV